MNGMIKYYYDIVKYHNPKMNKNDINELATNLATYSDAIVGCDTVLDKAYEANKPDLMTQYRESKQRLRIIFHEYKKTAGILDSEGNLTTSEYKRLSAIADKQQIGALEEA